MRILFRFLSTFQLLFLVALALPLEAQNVVPERRLALTRNMDFPGSDLEPLFETTFETCRKVCLANKECRAFTFNISANACFPKSSISQKIPFEGAFSAEVFETDLGVLALQDSRLKSLSFLQSFYLSEARIQAEKLSDNYVTNQWTADQLIEAADNALNAGNLVNALKFQGAALNLTDAADGWVEIASLALRIKGANNTETNTYRRIASSAAINGYLRAKNVGIQVTALNLLAKAVEVRGDGRQSIRVLRLAQAIQPRLDTEDALTRAIGLYGFRITEHKVDNNAASPRICAVFSENLVKNDVDYADFLRLPDAGMAVESDDTQICVTGAEHGQRYRLSFREGLPAASGEKLTKTVDLDLYVRDRDPSARFTGRAYVVPKGEAASIPIVTVNLSEVELKILRVGDRNLVRAVQSGFLGRAVSFWDEETLSGSIGSEVWSGTGVVNREVNRDVTTALPIGDAIDEFQPGVYVLQARVPGSDPYDVAWAAQWFIVTDLGATTMKGGDGLHVFVRSLNSAAAKPGVAVELLARNNNVLGTATTDADGYAHFATAMVSGTGSNAPAMVNMLNSDGDFAFLSLSDAAFDLSDRGVEGRDSPPPLDVFVTTDRGAYRVGETVFATILARDERAEALSGLPLTAIVKRPDGVEFSRALLDDQGAGGRVLTLALPNAAQRGAWNIQIHTDPDKPALVAQKFLVEDLIPERIDFDLTFETAPVSVDGTPRLAIDAKYLYGAPAGGLGIEIETRVSPAPGFEGYKDYRFGSHEDYVPNRTEFTGDAITDPDGFAQIDLMLPSGLSTSKPLKIDAIVRIREGSGRPVERQISQPMMPGGTLIGIKPLFDDVAPENAAVGFDVLAIDRALNQTALPRVAWVINRVRTRYQWYESYGNWNYEPVTTRTRVANGEIALGTDGPTRIEAGVEWGRYELKLETIDGEHLAASTEFWAGWYAPVSATDTPDTLEIGLDRDGYAIGDKAQVRIVPRHAGIALVSVMSNRLIAMKAVPVTAGENIIALDVTEEWGAGAYVSASVIRPMDVAAGHNPARAIGLSWAAVDPGDHQLSARFTNAPEVSPRATMTAELEVTGARSGEQVYATIAAVDVGILNLTGFKSPDPSGHYFGQRKLGMELRDVYGRLIDGLMGDPGQMRSGGDGPLADKLQSPPPTDELVAYFSGPLMVGADGKVTAEFDVPEFNGTIRLMAVVWSETGVGQAAMDVLARDPIVLTASLPRFLAPYDESRMLLEIAHASGPEGLVEVDLRATSGLYIDTSAIPSRLRFTKNERKVFEVPINAPVGGDPEITVTMTIPDGSVLTKTLTLPVRANDPEIARTQRVSLADGDTFTLDKNVFAGLMPGTGRATLAVGPLARFDAPGLLSALDRYPYGCTEQITSKALPLLYFESVADAMGLSVQRNITTRVNQAIAEVLSNQASNGSFGLWRPESGDLWLDSYVSDFLSRARGKGFVIPAQAFRLAMDNLRNRVNYASDFENGGTDIAYALMVLAREGAANIGDMRYYADTKSNDFRTPLALAQLGTALAYYGDQRRADKMFREAGARLEAARNQKEDHVWRSDYGTHLRDTAAVLTLAVEAGTEVLDQTRLANRITPETLGDITRSTQENMWSLMAANALIDDLETGAFLMNGKPVEGPLVEVLDARTGADRSVEVLNQSGKSAETILTTFGIPEDPEPASGNGYTIDRFYFTMDGKPITPERLALNERLVVVVKVTPQRYSEARLIVNDPLPAGLEIDNPNLLRSGDVSALDWIKLNVDPRNVEFRSERFIAAVDWSSKEPFQLAYIVRAISPGSFHHPAAAVEDMYRPQFRARTGVGRVNIAAR